MRLAYVQCASVHAVVQPGGVQRGQASGVFANETGRSGWTQLLDSVDVHPPLAHQLPAGPPPQTHPPAIMQSQAADQQPAPHMAVQDSVQEAVPAAAPGQHAQPVEEDRQDVTDFQYDSFSDSLEDEQMPEAAPQASDRHDQTASELPPPHAAVDSASGQVTADSFNPAAASDQGEQWQQQRQQQQQPQQQQQQQHIEEDMQSDDRPGVIPQTDGAGDSDTLDSQGTSAQHAPSKLHEQNAHSNKPCSSAPPQPVPLPAAAGRGEAEQCSGQVAPATRDTAGAVAQQQSQLGLPNTVAAGMPVQRVRKRRSRQVVQHAVRLAAAARDAMTSVATLEDASNNGKQAGLQSEPQLPSWLQPQPNAAGRHMQSEPQLPWVWDRPGRGSRPGQVPSVLPSSTAQHGPVGHMAQADSRYGGLGRPGTVLSHQRLSQSTVAAADGSAPCVRSQVIPDSRATSDLHWQQQQHQQQREMAFPMVVHSQRLESQVVSDSRATSDLRWAQHAQDAQTQQAAFQQQPDPNQHQYQGQHLLQASAEELAWEQPHQLPPIPLAAAMSETSEAACPADELEVVISDSQPSPPQHAGRPGGTPHPAIVANAATVVATSAPDGQALEQQILGTVSQPNAAVPDVALSRLASKADLQVYDPDAAAAVVPGPDQVNDAIGNSQQEQQQESATAADPASIAHAPDQATGGVASFSTGHKLAGSHFSDEALTPVLVPHAHARIQVQHEATPSLAVVRDTPQSALAVTPWSRVRDTPRSAATPLQRVLPPQGLWLGLDQPSASKPPSVPLQSSVHTTSSTLQLPHKTNTTDSRADQLQRHRASHEQLHATPTAPELTLRLSLSDGSSTKSNKAAQPSPQGGSQPAHQQPSPTHALGQARQLPALPVGTAPAHRTVLEQTGQPPAASSLLQLSPAHQPAKDPAQNRATQAQPQQHDPNAAASSPHERILFREHAAKSASAISACAADLPQSADPAHETDTQGDAAQGSPDGLMQESTGAPASECNHNHDQDHAQAEPGPVANNKNEALGGKAAGHTDLQSADLGSDQQHGDDNDALMHPTISNHGEANKAEAVDTASDDASSDDKAPDYPHPDCSPASSASRDLVCHRYKQRAPTQVI